jgi:hypothetical protein
MGWRVNLYIFPEYSRGYKEILWLNNCVMSLNKYPIQSH